MRERLTRYLLFIIPIVVLFLLCTCVSGEELHVGFGQTYSSIQDAINDANESDTIVVHSGTYSENIVVNKTLTINGVDGKSVTTIDGNDALKQTVQITADNVQLYGFTIKNTIGVSQQKACILISSATGGTIRDNEIKNGQDGIDVFSSSSTSIYDNTIEDNEGSGIWLYYSDNNQIYQNTIKNNNMKGVLLTYSSNNNIYNNVVSGNFDKGIYLQFSNDNVIHNNEFLDNNGGHAYESTSSNTWYYNSQGNYWDDYNGYDESPKDGIGDTPYDIPGGSNQDLYPLGNFIQENQAPVANIVSVSPNPASVGDVIHFDGSSSDDGTIVQWQWRANGNIIGTSEDFSYSGFSTGTYTITFRVQDDDSTWSDYDQTTLTINEVEVTNNPPSVTTMSIMPTKATFGDTVYFSGEGSDSDSGDSIAGYEWTSDLDGFLYNGKSFTKNDLSVGTHTISFKVRDTHGSWSSSVTKTVIINPEQNSENNPPTADAGGPYNGVANNTVTFDGSNSYDSDAGDSITKYYWSFGDGETAEGTTVEHVYSTAGTYTVELTVTDNYGEQSKDTILVTVVTENSGSNGGADNNGGSKKDKLVIPGFEIIIIVIILIVIICFIMYLRK